MSDPQRGAVSEPFLLHNAASSVLDGFFHDLVQGVPALQAMELALKNLQAAQNEDAALRSRPSRDEALEEAAVACEKYQDNVADRLADFSSHWQLGAAAGAEDCSEAIRALKSQPAAQNAEQSSVPGAVDALRELVACKDMKDELDRVEVKNLAAPRNYYAEELREKYEARKTLAWETARAELKRTDERNHP